MRPAEKVIEEINYYYQLNGTKNFEFPDNTINGSDSEFLKFLKLLAKWQKKNTVQVSWLAQFSIKPIRQQKSEMFDLLRETNANLAVGFDHCSDRVLYHMKKLYTWKDIKNFLIEINKRSIPIVPAMWIVGYPTETDEDFMEYQKLIDFIQSEDIKIGSHIVMPCSINVNSPLMDIVDIDRKEPDKWISNIGIDRECRIKRKKWLDDKLLSINQNYWKLNDSRKRTLRD